ncbi:cinnamyl alcohol dehydrogenase homolog 2 [Actinidia rufa]|uniref:Cinnamyl alcohol dehydrogenase homolog 2 n=1 Tax=Actinidia rufa TaxID=165716 RepID=A0A7J0GI66_9ERIC|nr:cinnamyl alcohol dehydrogenase homolog 2 [Actinidia rufa]
MAQTTPNHTQTVSGWAAHDSSGKITPYPSNEVELSNLQWGLSDLPWELVTNGIKRQKRNQHVTIKILSCGICHTDVHYAKNDWGITRYPVVPGHEITGLITELGSSMTEFKIRDRVGVGYLAGSCLECEFCNDSQENYCDQIQTTYWLDVAQRPTAIPRGVRRQKVTCTSESLLTALTPGMKTSAVVDGLPLGYRWLDGRLVEATYAIVELLRVTILDFLPLILQTHTHTYNGIFWDGSVTYGGYSKMFIADHSCTPVMCRDNSVLPIERQQHARVMRENNRSDWPGRARARTKRSLDFILDTVSAKHSLGPYLELLKVNGTLMIVGAPDKPIDLPSFPLIFGTQVVKGSMTGSMKETQEPTNVCGKYNITCDIETIKPGKINEVFDRLVKNNVKYFFVIDIWCR